MRVALLHQVTLIPALLLGTKTAEAPSGSLHLSISPSDESDGDEPVIGGAQDVTCTNAELCERAAQLLADVERWYADEKARAVRTLSSRALTEPRARTARR